MQFNAQVLDKTQNSIKFWQKNYELCVNYSGYTYSIVWLFPFCKSVFKWKAVNE